MNGILIHGHVLDANFLLICTSLFTDFALGLKGAFSTMSPKELIEDYDDLSPEAKRRGLGMWLDMFQESTIKAPLNSMYSVMVPDDHERAALIERLFFADTTAADYAFTPEMLANFQKYVKRIADEMRAGDDTGESV